MRTFDEMKAIYISLLLAGLAMMTLGQLVDYALPPDAYVASTLSRNPDAWTISVDENVKRQLDGIEVKEQIVRAFTSRASFRAKLYSENLWEGAALLVLSSIGLIRERKITMMRKLIERSSQ